MDILINTITSNTLYVSILLYKDRESLHIITIFGMLLHILARFFFNMYYKAVTKVVFLFVIAQRDLQFQNLIQRYLKGFLRRPHCDFFKN